MTHARGMAEHPPAVTPRRAMQRIQIRNFDLNLLVVFAVLYESRSVTRASERLSLTQPAVSHALKRLRDAIGDPLFLQSKRGLVPTARAEQLVEPARRALAEVETALSGAPAFDPASSTREFDIAASELVELGVVPRLLGVLHQVAPHVHVRLNPMPDEAGAISELETGARQLMIGSQVIKSSALRNETVAEIRLAVLCGRSLGCSSRTVPLELYLRTPHVVLRHQGPRRNVINESFTARNLDRRVGAVVQNFVAMAMVAAECGYICHMPAAMARRFARTLGLTVHASPLGLKPSPVVLTSHRRADSDPAVGWLLQQTRTLASRLQ